MDVRRTIATLSAATLVAGTLVLPMLAVADSASVTVTFSVNPTVATEVVDDGLLVRSNAPWTLVAETADGPLTASGPATGSAGVLIDAEGLRDYSLVLDTPR